MINQDIEKAMREELPQYICVNFQQRDLQKFSQQKGQKTAIIIGLSGHGKTSLFNKLCQRNQKVDISIGTVTNETVHGKAKLKQQNKVLYVYDTPGICGTSAKINLILKRTLKYIKSNSIIVVTKLHNRFGDNTINQMKKISNFLRNDRTRIIFVVSDLDMLYQSNFASQERSKIIKQFEQQLIRQRIEQKVILYSARYSTSFNYSNIAELLYNCICSIESQPKTIELDMRRTARFFNIDVEQLVDQGEQELFEKLDMQHNSEKMLAYINNCEGVLAKSKQNSKKIQLQLQSQSQSQSQSLYYPPKIISDDISPQPRPPNKNMRNFIFEKISKFISQFYQQKQIKKQISNEFAEQRNKRLKLHLELPKKFFKKQNSASVVYDPKQKKPNVQNIQDKQTTNKKIDQKTPSQQKQNQSMFNKQKNWIESVRQNKFIHIIKNRQVFYNKQDYNYINRKKHQFLQKMLKRSIKIYSGILNHLGKVEFIYI